MSIEFPIEGELEFDDVLRNDREKNPNIPKVYFMVHANENLSLLATSV